MPFLYPFSSTRGRMMTILQFWGNILGTFGNCLGWGSVRLALGDFVWTIAGDLRYKKRDDLPPSAQIVTADPEIREHTLTVDDQLLILGCDGIWERSC
eukprot:3226807-Amphidinium_carterae.1